MYDLQITPQVIVSRSPRSGSVLGQVPIATPLQIRSAMDEARLGHVAWRGIGLQRRLALARGIRDSLYRHRERVVDVLVAELGKVDQEAWIELLAVMEMVDFYLREAPEVLREQEIPVRLVPNRRFFVQREPFGVVLVIAPWNYPLWLSLGPIVAALITGNSVIYKPSEYATQLASVIALIVTESGVPEEVFQVLYGHGDVGAALIEAHPDRIVFTGGASTGKKIARAAADRLIPTTLELGGKDAAIVLEDADIEYSAAGIVWSGMFNAGQTCASIERVIVVREVADQLIDAMKRAIERFIPSNGDEPAPWFASITTPVQIEIVSAQIDEAVAKGARAVVGGKRISGTRFFEPTLLVDVTPDMRICCEETFGPIIAVMIVDDEADAIKCNNETPYGLTASIWTRNLAHARRIAHQLEVANVSVNDHLLISGVPEMPWGGIKESGYGRTQGAEGLLDLTYAKTLNHERFRLPVEPFWYPYTPIKRSLLQRAIHLLYGPSLRDRLRAMLP